MRVLLVGANGFLGRNLYEYLSWRGIDVLAVTSNNSDQTNHTSAYRVGDFISERILEYSNFDAAIFATRGKNTIDMEHGVIELVRRMNGKVPMILNFSTYAQHYEIPRNARIYEYVQSKKLISGYLQSHRNNYAFLDISLFTLVGEMDHPSSLMSQIIQSGLTGAKLSISQGNQLISYTAVSDICFLIYKILSGENLIKSGIYSAWPEPPQRIKDIVEFTRSISPHWFPVAYGDIPYGGHEIFTYHKELFPQQVDAEFKWKKVEDSIKELFERKASKD